MYFTVYHTQEVRKNKRLGFGQLFNAIGGVLIGKSGSSEGSAKDPVSSSEGVTSSVTTEAQRAIETARGQTDNMEKEFIRKDVENSELTQDQIDADAIARKLLGE